jgi:hypothetical protein
MLGSKGFEFTDNGGGASARDFSFCAGDVDRRVVFHQRGGEHVDEGEVA